MKLWKTQSAKQRLLNAVTSFQFLPPCTEPGRRGRESTLYVDSHIGFGSLSGKIRISLGTVPAHTVYTVLNANKLFYPNLLHLATAF